MKVSRTTYVIDNILSKVHQHHSTVQDGSAVSCSAVEGEGGSGEGQQRRLVRVTAQRSAS